jgi:multiple sugar transport system ATP-binding protein
MNFMQGKVERHDGHVTVCIGDFHLTPADEMQPLLASYVDRAVNVGIRAENMQVLQEPSREALQVEVFVVEPLGSQNLLTVQIGDETVKVATHPDMHVDPGTDIWLRFPSDKIRFVDPESGQVLYPAESEV